MNKKGISLIVLSITILVMAILAATAIIALEDSGIIGRAKNTTKNTNYADEYTRLVVIKNGILTDNLGEITVLEYVTELTNKGLIESAKTTNADGSVTVTTKTGFDVIISQNGESDLGIVIDGYTPPSSNNGGDNTGGNNSATIYQFKIDNITYSAEAGMTWTTWCNSAYNTAGFYIGTHVGFPTGILYNKQNKIIYDSYGIEILPNFTPGNGSKYYSEVLDIPTGMEIEILENGVPTNDVVYQFISDTEIEFVYTGDNEIIGWDFPYVVEGNDYMIIDESLDSRNIWIELINGYDGDFIANALTE